MHPRHTYFLFTALYDLGLSFTIVSYGPYLIRLGLSPSQMGQVNLWFWVTILLCELPTGLFADRFGRALSVRVGVTVTGLSALLYATATGFITAVLYEMLIGVGMAFISGALGAWIKDALHARGEDEAYGSTVARAAQYRSIATLVGGVAGGWAGMREERWTWLMAGSSMLVAAIIAFRSMHEDRVPSEPVAVRPNPLRMSWRILCTGRGLLWAAVAGMAFGLVLPFNHFWSPYFGDKIGRTDTTLLWVPMNASLALAAYLVRRKGLSAAQEAPALTFSLLLTGLGLACIGLMPGTVMAVTFVVLHELGRGMFFPLLEIFIQRRVESAYRATYGSLHSLLSRIGYVAVLSVVSTSIEGRPWDADLIATVWTATGTLLTVIAVALGLIVLRRRVLDRANPDPSRTA